VYIPKADGRQRPLGIAALEDKILQSALCEVLNAIYETDFVGFSYGFRPGRNQHQALDAIVVGIRYKKVNWVLDADIRGYFDTIDHEWLQRFLQHRQQRRRNQILKAKPPKTPSMILRSRTPKAKSSDSKIFQAAAQDIVQFSALPRLSR
jgi:retron-type reverse transcriptase